MNFSILIVIIVLSIILAAIVYHITEKYKVLTVLTEIIIIIISILVSWLKTDDNDNGIEYTSNPITTTVETLEQTEVQEVDIETAFIPTSPKTDNSTSYENTTTNEAITSTTTTQTTTIEETQKVDPNYLFEIPNPEEIDLISGSLSGKYSGNSIYFTPPKSGYYGFAINHNSTISNSDAKVNIVNASGSYFSISINDKTSYHMKKDTKYQIYFIEESSKIKKDELYYNYEVKMYYPSEVYDIEGSFTGSLLFNGQCQKLYYKPLVSGEYSFNFKNYDELFYEFECYKLNKDYPINSKTIKKERDKLTIDLTAGETYEIRITSKDILQGQYEVTIN